VLGGPLLYVLIGRPLTRAILRRPRATAASTVAVTTILMGVLPAQVLAEAQGYRWPAVTQAVDAGAATEPGGEPASMLAPARAADQEDVGQRADWESPLGERPNVVLITIDTLRADHLGACGEARGLTPHLDRLAERGTLFCQTYVHQPHTNPSLSSLFTGQFPATHGVRAHMTDRLPETVPTLATLLGDAGYATAGIAPWTSLKPAFSGLHRGFETYLAAAIGEPAFLEHPLLQGAAGVYRRIKDQLWLGRMISPLGSAEDALEERLDGRGDVSTEQALAWLATNQREPFLLWVHYFDPHYPWTPPPPYDTKYDPDYLGSSEDVYDGSWRTFYAYATGEWAPQPRDVEHLQALYAGEVSYADEQIGRLLATLEQTGLDATTLVVVTADHGESFGEHDQWLHGDSLYEHELRVPLLVAGPGVPPGRQMDGLARQVDVLPTILDLLRLPPAGPIDGRSLVPLMLGEEDGQERVSFGQIADDSILAIVTGDQWKLILDYRRDTIELYYLPDDPQETDNRAPREWWRVRELFGQLDDWAKAKRMDWLKLPEFRFGL
ncbi:MAG: sulfatase family protein, partial [Chloroflexota bacterium]